MRRPDDGDIELTKKPQAPVPFTSKEIREMAEEESKYLHSAREDLKTTGRLAGGIGGIALLIGFIALALFLAQLGGILAVATTPLLIAGIVAAAIVAICAIAGGITASRLKTAIAQSEKLLDQYDEALRLRETQTPTKTGSPSQTEIPSKFTTASPSAQKRGLSDHSEGSDRDPEDLSDSDTERHPPSR